MYDIEALKGIVRPLLSDKRYFHTLCVAREAKMLAQRFGCEVNKAEAAGVLHDVMKDTPFDEQLKIFSRFGIMLNEYEKASKQVWHQISGAAYIENVLKIEDPEILSAVRYHTTGRKEMALLDKIVFLADAVSADRNYQGVEEIRLALKAGLDAAVLTNTGLVIRSFIKKQLPVVPDTFEAYNRAALLKTDLAERNL